MRVATDAEREKRMRNLVVLVVDPVRRCPHRRTADVIGDTLLVCWRRLDEVPADALPWAIVVARQCLSNAQRAERRRIRLVDRIIAVDLPPAAAGENAAASTVDGGAELRAVYDAAFPGAVLESADIEGSGQQRGLHWSVGKRG